MKKTPKTPKQPTKPAPETQDWEEPEDTPTDLETSRRHTIREACQELDLPDFIDQHDYD